ncbi:MAG: Gfo/Idh/MocA family oxidoreductase [Clostridia bacterium]|nr:Gfo/Idh/MocA family oxidoreductase [Clostridia bacterium]
MKIVLVGAGGYGSGYVKRLLIPQDPQVVLEGIVDPYFSSCATKNEIEAAGIPVYETMDGFYAEHGADLAVICTPPFLHREQSICALRNGSYVLCEKPVAPTVTEANAMAQAEEEYGKWIAIGYQWSFSEAIRELKKDILAERLGNAVFLKTIISWPRNRAYYARGGGWGGKMFWNGAPLLDSVVSNACAHYLHNMLFLLGDRMNRSARVTELSGDCFRANAIENFDTCSLKLRTEQGAELYFLASHAARKALNPEFEYVFERATVTFSEDNGSLIRASFADGSEKIYGDPFADSFEKLRACIAAIRNGEAPICTVRTATPHTEVIQQIWKELPIVTVPAEMIQENPTLDGIYVEGLFESMLEAYTDRKLLSQVDSTLFGNGVK